MELSQKNGIDLQPDLILKDNSRNFVILLLISFGKLQFHQFLDANMKALYTQIVICVT